DLGLVLEAAEGARVHDAVAVALEGGAIGMLGLGCDATSRVGRARRPRREPLALLALLVGARAERQAAHRRLSSRSASRSTRSSCAREASSVSPSGALVARGVRAAGAAAAGAAVRRAGVCGGADSSAWSAAAATPTPATRVSQRI